MTTRHLEEYEDFAEPFRPGLDFFKDSVSYTKYTVALDEGITDPSYYRKVFHMLENCKEGDVVRIIINNGGGLLSTALHFASLLRVCEATTVAVIACECHSGASMIALACDEFEVMPWAHMLIHNAEYGFGGKAADVEAHVDFSKKQLTRVMNEVYSGFLSSREIARAVRGEQLYFDTAEINKRIVNFMKYRESKILRAPEPLVE